MFSALDDISLSVLLQKNRDPVIPKQNVSQDYVSLSLPKIPGSTDLRHEVISNHQFILCRAMGVEFLLVEPTMVNPRPKENPPPECPQIFKMDSKRCVHPPLKNTASVGNENHRQRARASDVSHHVDHLIPIV